jgi:hypothetical protein
VYGAAWSGSRFTIVGQFGITQTSPDGISWSGFAVYPYNSDLNGVTWFIDKFVAVGAGGRILTAH